MDKREAAGAWRYFQFNWILIAIMAAALLLGVAFTDFTLKGWGYALILAIAALYAGMAHYNATAPHRGNPVIVFALGAPAQLLLIVSIATPLSYVASAANFPMQDQTLLAIDRALGLDFRPYLAFVNERPNLVRALVWGYFAITWPMFLIPFTLAALGHYRRTQEFTFATAVALLVTIVVSMLVPATGVYETMGLTAADYSNLTPKPYLDSLTEIPAVRDGSLRELDLLKLIGILTFPSFHTASAVLYAWAFWPIRWLLPANLAVNGLLIASTPIGGGHYFIDLLAGAITAAGAILLAKYIGRKFLPRTAAEPGTASSKAWA